MSRVLTAYFSASGVTKALAERLAGAIGADLFEIAPLVPYTRADLDWRDRNSRSTIEMNDRACRPEMAGKADNMEAYDVVFVGFPIWWYREPSIIDSFIEAYDFTGKRIAPFATSGGSGMGDSSENIQALAPGAKVERGRRFPANAGETELKLWAANFIDKT